MGGGWEERRRKIQIKEATAGIIISKLPVYIMSEREKHIWHNQPTLWAHGLHTTNALYMTTLMAVNMF